MFVAQQKRRQDIENKVGNPAREPILKWAQGFVNCYRHNFWAQAISNTNTASSRGNSSDTTDLNGRTTGALQGTQRDSSNVEAKAMEDPREIDDLKPSFYPRLSQCLSIQKLISVGGTGKFVSYCGGVTIEGCL